MLPGIRTYARTYVRTHALRTCVRILRLLRLLCLLSLLRLWRLACLMRLLCLLCLLRMLPVFAPVAPLCLLRLACVLCVRTYCACAPRLQCCGYIRIAPVAPVVPVVPGGTGGMFCMFCLVCLLRLPSLFTLTNSPSPLMLHMLRLLRLLCLLRLLDPQQRAKSEEKEGDEQKHLRMHGARAATFASDAVAVTHAARVHYLRSPLAGGLPLARAVSRGAFERPDLCCRSDWLDHDWTWRTGSAAVG